MDEACIAIRRLDPADVPAVAALLDQLARKSITGEFSKSAEETFLQKNNAEGITRFIAGSHVYHVALANGKIVGFVGMRDNAHLYHLFVAEEVQRMGVARKLWKVAKEACRAAGNPGRYTVNASNFAVPVYESFGFVRSKPPQNAGGLLYNPMELIEADCGL